MKLSIAALFLSSIASSVSAYGQVSEDLMNAARRLGNDDQAAQSEFAFLGDYEIKMVSCKSGNVYVNPVSGASEYSSVVFRLCPTTGECSDTGDKGCSTGYGDYVIGLETFASLYLEDKRESMQQDDAFKVEDLGTCREYQGDKDGEDGGAVYYVGPACTSDGTGVKVALFTDAYCKTLSESVTFEDLSNGISLPYSTGGLVGQGCESCMETNDKGEYGLSDFCYAAWEYSGKCETKMKTYHYSGQTNSSCEAISALMPRSAKSGKGGKIVGWMFFVLVVVGVGVFAFTAMKKKKDDKSFGLMT